MTKHLKEYIKLNLPYYGKIPTKGRYSGVKAKAWAILSDYVRCRDFAKYKKCVARGTFIQDWRDTDAGHFHAMSGNGALIGFHHLNIHMQSKISNKISSQADGLSFGKELVRRYGKNILVELERIKNTSVKADDLFFIEIIKDTYKRFQELKKDYPNINYPEYL